MSINPAMLLGIAVLVGSTAAFAQQPDPFNRLDRNGDGKITEEELPPNRRGNFSRIDVDDDGGISREEDAAFRRRGTGPGAGRGLPDSIEARRDIPYAGTDHPRQRLDLYLPKERGDDRLPMIVFIHGGAWRAGEKSGGAGQVARFVASGEFAGASIGYRLSSDAIWPAQIHDCKAAIRWIRAHAEELGIDPDRIGVMGSSAGGHLVAMLGTSAGVADLEGDLGEHTGESSRVTCVVDLFGPAEMLTMGDEPSRIDHNAPNSPESLLLGGAVPSVPDAARSASPTEHVSPDDAPFLIIHGTDDPLVPYKQSTRLHELLRMAQVPSTLITVEGGQHGGFRSSEVDRRIRLFFERHLLGREVVVEGGVVEQGQQASANATDTGWKRHVVHQGERCVTAVAGDFTGDGKPDIISNSAGKTRLFVAPDWNEVLLDQNPEHSFIHSETFDVDGDGDLDYIGARYNPGLIVWLECPDNPTAGNWTARIGDDQVHGIHGLIKGDVDQDGDPDLLATSAQPLDPFPYSLAWLRVPANSHDAQRWKRFIFADRDAPGLTHYLGFGDVNGDGRPDAATGAKGGPQAEPGTGDYFAWWEAPADPTGVWTRHDIATDQPGATNIHPVDVNGDGTMDFIASRGHGNGVVWFEGPNWDEHVIHATIKEPHCLVAIDLDGDGDIDAATCAYGDQLCAWFENDGQGRFDTHIVGDGQEAYDIRAANLDGDGDLDLLIAGRASDNVVWYENPGK